MIEFMEIKRYPLINQKFENGFQQNEKKMNSKSAHNLQIKNRINPYYVLIVISKYETQDSFKEDKCKVLATENNTNKAKSKILILPAT